MIDLERAGADLIASQSDRSATVEALYRRATRRRHRQAGAALVSLAVVVGLAVALVPGTGARKGTEVIRAPKTSVHELLARPLHLPSLKPGQSCPATPGRPLRKAVSKYFGGPELGVAR